MKNPYLKNGEIKGPFDSRDIVICYNENIRNKVVDLNIVYKPIPAEGSTLDPVSAASFSSYSRRWRCDLPINKTETAASVFGYLLSKGFESQEEILKAIRAFGDIVECGWAREMTSAFGDGAN